MKLPLSWLREFIAVDATAQQIAARLRVAGLVVEIFAFPAERLKAYATLGLPLSASIEDVKSTHRVVAKALHPDRLQAADTEARRAAEHLLGRINHARSVLVRADEARREVEPTEQIRPPLPPEPALEVVVDVLLAAPVAAAELSPLSPHPASIAVAPSAAIATNVRALLLNR